MIKKVLMYVVYVFVVMMVFVIMWLVTVELVLTSVAVRTLEKDTVIPTFTEQEIEYSHIYTQKDTFPMVDGTIFDIEGDGIAELFVTGAAGQSNLILTYKDGAFIDVTEGTGLEGIDTAAHGVEVLDVDRDRDDDLVVARHDGVFLYTNRGGTYTESKIDIDFEDSVIPLNVSVSDVDRDGYPDIYVSTFKEKKAFKQMVFNDEENKSANVFLHNNRNGTFTDVTEESGLLFRQNTFLARFVDFNNDKLDDLIVAPNTDQVHIYENLGNGTFKDHIILEYGFWMGIATTDIDKDGDTDVFISNVGNTVPKFMVSGDARDDQPIDTGWRMLRNEGGFEFTDITEERGLDINIFSWGTEFADFNNDGRDDLVVLENYLEFPMHKMYRNPGKVLIQGTDGKFVRTERQSGVMNRMFGYTPVVYDFNDDGFTDLVYLNQNGPVRIFLNNGVE